MPKKLNPEEEQTLLKLLCGEIARDGGASFVTFLKEYDNAPLNKLLQGVKLLTFIESFPKILDVNRLEKPHFVKLLSYSHVTPPECTHERKEDKDVCDKMILDNDYSDKAYTDLCDKIVYALRKRHSRMERKHQQNTEAYTLSVNIYWLMKRCSIEFHRFFRSQDLYRAYYTSEGKQVWPVGSKEWYDAFLPKFASFLLEQSHIIKVKDDKIWLIEIENICLSNPTKSTNSYHVDDDYLQRLDKELTDLVDKDGATQITLSLLLCKDEIGSFRRLLGGRDLWKLYQTHYPRGFFKNVKIWSEYSDIYLQSLTQNHTGRMEVDKVGLFSVASTKWGKAIAKLVVQYCRQVFDDGAEEEKTIKNQSMCSKSTKTAVDLTASVGGLVLGLAKTYYFSKVVGMEIDPLRADLCQQNMISHNVSEIVDIQNVDSTKKLDRLTSQIQNLCCVVIDPPWGGIHYKRDKNPTLYLGSLSLEDVLLQIFLSISDEKGLIVGLRLPVTFQVVAFLDILKQRNKVIFKSMTVRKFGPQIVVVLHILRPVND